MKILTTTLCIVLSLMICFPSNVVASSNLLGLTQTKSRENLDSWKVTLDDLEWYIKNGKPLEKTRAKQIRTAILFIKQNGTKPSTEGLSKWQEDLVNSLFKSHRVTNERRALIIKKMCEDGRFKSANSLYDIGRTVDIYFIEYNESM